MRSGIFCQSVQKDHWADDAVGVTVVSDSGLVLSVNGEGPALHELAVEVPAVVADCPIIEVDRMFRQDRRLRAVVVGSGATAGLLSRAHLEYELSGPFGYGRSLHSRSVAADLLSDDRFYLDAAHALGLSVTAEGAERRTQLEVLRALGCDAAQGYLIARPTSAADLI
jgi:hypothetical protein